MNLNTIRVIKIKHDHIDWYDVDLVINAWVWRRSKDQSVNVLKVGESTYDQI